MKTHFRRRLAGLVTALVGLSACSDFSAALNFDGLVFDAKRCTTADDCAAPFACCTGGIAIQAEAGESGDLSPRCLPPDEYCDAYLPHLIAGQPCRRSPPAIDSISNDVIYTGLDECRDGLLCCPSTLTCAVATECPAEPAEPAEPVLPAGGADAGGTPGEPNCSADEDCTGGLLCCGISYVSRAGTCVAPRACGATSFAGGVPSVDSDAGVPDAGPGGCVRPAGAPVAGCENVAPAPPTPGLALQLDFEQAALCDASGRAHHATLADGAVRVGGPDGSGALDGTATLPIYESMNPAGGLTATFFISRRADGVFAQLGGDIALATGGCGELRAIAGGKLVDSPCGVTPGSTWVHGAVVIDPTAVTIYVGGVALVSGAGVTLPDLCGTVTLGGNMALLDRFRWYTRALGPEEICIEAGRSFAGGMCQ